MGSSGRLTALFASLAFTWCLMCSGPVQAQRSDPGADPARIEAAKKLLAASG
jgi:hypothetical protein